jgi:ribosomal protein S18 acetylase RimI-like enzyme
MTRQSEPCERLAWDSAFFGMPIARVNAGALDEARAGAVDAWCTREGVACAYFLAAANEPATARCAAAHGFSLVEVRLEFDWLPPAFSDHPSHPPTATAGATDAMSANVREVVPADVPALEAIARSSFTDSRFYMDGRFPRERCDDFYAHWLRESCRPGGIADAVLVAEQHGAPVAFLTCQLQEGGRLGRIGLVGVEANCRGRGVGQQLVRAAQQWFLNQGVHSVRVVTQSRNIASQRLYQRCGFLTYTVGLYYHKWYS